MDELTLIDKEEYAKGMNGIRLGYPCKTCKYPMIGCNRYRNCALYKEWFRQVWSKLYRNVIRENMEKEK